MTTLDAVNEILAGVNEPPATALDTGGSTDVAEAETFLDRSNRTVQEEGWTFNTRDPYEITTASVVVTVGAITGTYQPLETVTQSGSGATGVLIARSGSSLYIAPSDDSASFAGSGTMTGGTSGATATASAVADVTTAPIQIPSTWLLVSRSRLNGVGRGSVDFVWSGTVLYDRENQTALFDPDLLVSIAATELITFTSVPVPIQQYIVAHAAVRYQRYRKAGRIDDSFLTEQLAIARVRAQQHEQDVAGPTLLQTPESLRMFGSSPAVVRII